MALVIFGLAAAARMLYLYHLSSSLTFDDPIVDAGTYDRLARALAAGQPFTHEHFWQPFFYPFFVHRRQTGDRSGRYRGRDRAGH